MDPTRFDALIRTLSQVVQRPPSRRAVLAAASGLLAGILAGPADTDAKRKRRQRRRRNRKQKRQKRCPTGQVRCETGCAGCCTDTDCGGNACVEGRCAECPAGQRRCRGGCIAGAACCSDDECTGGQVCIDAGCTCRAHERLCQGGCIPKDECCGTDCPPAPPPSTCSAETCGGCCEGSVCKNGDSQNFCGRDGVECDRCDTGEVCDAGQCRCPHGSVPCADGSCIACAPGFVCEDGQCVCPAGRCCSNADCTGGYAGRCRPDGTCVYLPDCMGTGQDCTFLDCCSSVACLEDGDGKNVCYYSFPGDPCKVDTDCSSGQCIYYQCV